MEKEEEFEKRAAIATANCEAAQTNVAIGQELTLPTTINSSTAVVHAIKDKSIDYLFKRILPNILFMLKDSNYKKKKI